ncbi:hypothetical protein ACSHWG_00825 [Leucobacter sp. Z1108]|uniref:hypothetical protein n=1 Tax=Leucobacter sp. Z1108 TaxID=3439066 RepID=UPI003F34DC8A
MYEITEVAKAAKIASYTPEKLRDLREWAEREREWIHATARPFMASMPDRALRDIADVLDRADTWAGESLELPRLGRVDAVTARRVQGWVVAEVKSRNAVAWHAAHDVQSDLFSFAVARSQGVEVAAIDWEALDDESPLWDGHASAYEIALRELGPTADEALLRDLQELQRDLEAVDA